MASWLVTLIPVLRPSSPPPRTWSPRVTLPHCRTNQTSEVFFFFWFSRLFFFPFYPASPLIPCSMIRVARRALVLLLLTRTLLLFGSLSHRSWPFLFSPFLDCFSLRKVNILLRSPRSSVPPSLLPPSVRPVWHFWINAFFFRLLYFRSLIFVV